MIDKLICKVSDSLLKVMKIINDNAMGICFVVDGENRLCGTVTDGDIRRALLKDIGLNESVENIISPKCTYGYVTDDYDSLYKKIDHKVKVIPLVNHNMEVKDFLNVDKNAYFPVAIPNLNGNEFKYLTDAFLSTWISSSGEYITRFETAFSNYSDCQYGVACSNGTVALHLALMALDIGKEDEVIVPDLTFAATINSVIHAGGTPVIVDIEEDSWCIDPKAVEKAISPKTKAIIPVHLYGQACDMGAIMEIAQKHNLRVIEDCAEAHGAMFEGQKVGSFGDVGCFSFFGNKVITTGEGGMCITNDLRLNERMRVLRDHGMSKTKRYWHEVIGYNYRMTNLQAAIGLAQLERINEIHHNRREYEENYKSILARDNFTFQHLFSNRNKITWLVSVLVGPDIERDDYIDFLKSHGIDARPFFYPLSDMEIYKPYCKAYTPVAHDVSKVGLNLPTYENMMSVEQIRAILTGESYVQK